MPFVRRDRPRPQAHIPVVLFQQRAHPLFVETVVRCSSPPAGEHYAYEDRGHKFDFLLKPLPPTEDEEEEA